MCILRLPVVSYLCASVARDMRGTLSRVLRPQFCCARDAERKGESFSFRGPHPAAPTMPPASLPPGGGANIPAPPAAAAAPGIPHNFQEVVIAGADATLSYWACPAGAAIVRALPELGWIDASSILPGHRAAPSLYITAAAPHGHAAPAATSRGSHRHSRRCWRCPSCWLPSRPRLHV